jgi:hypothetical protein
VTADEIERPIAANFAEILDSPLVQLNVETVCEGRFGAQVEQIGRRVDSGHLASGRGKPKCLGALTTTDVEDGCPWSSQWCDLPADHFLSHDIAEIPQASDP